MWPLAAGVAVAAAAVVAVFAAVANAASAFVAAVIAREEKQRQKQRQRKRRMTPHQKKEGGEADRLILPSAWCHANLPTQAPGKTEHSSTRTAERKPAARE